MTADSLLTIPTGGVTTEGLKLNIAVTVVFISSWLRDRRGCLTFLGKAEDSASSLEKLARTPLKGYCWVMQHSWRVRGSHPGQIYVLENFE